MENPVLGVGAVPSWQTQDNHAAIHGDTGPDSIHDPGNGRRNPLACEMCCRKKIKCEVEGSNTTCIHCMRRNITCKFVSRKEKRENLKRTRYVKTLEDRLKRTESLLKAAGILKEDTEDHDDISIHEDGYSEDDSDIGNSQGRAFTSPHDASNSPRFGESDVGREYTSKNLDSQFMPNAHNFWLHDSSPSSNSSERRRSPPRKSTQRTTSGAKPEPRENCQYYGRSSSLSILTREGIEWIKNKSGEVKFLDILLSNSKFDSPWDYWRPDVFHDVFSSRVFKPLPPRAEVFSLLRDYFRTLNRIFPLYHEATFMELVEWQYTQQTCDDAARWASINIILSLAYEYRFSNSQKSEKDREKAWLYYKNAISVFAELSLRRTDLLSVQALLGMALFLRGNSGTQSTVPMITAAIRSAHRMGLHRDVHRPGLPEVEREQRKRVFWIAYILDQSTCIRLGNSPAQHFDDFDIGFPSDEADDGIIMADQKPFFPQLCRISMVKSRIYGQLYSAKALENKSASEICDLIQELHVELEKWKGMRQFDSLLKQKGLGEDFLVGFASAGLHLIYYNSLIMIHRLPLILNFAYKSRIDKGETLQFDAKLMLDQSSASAAVCVQAARDTLKLVNNLPWGDIAWIWSLLYYVFLAVMTIFVNLLRNSQQPTAKDDLQSLNMASTFFATLIPSDGPCNHARFMTRMSSVFERIARGVFERDQKAVRLVTDMNSRLQKARIASSVTHDQKSLLSSCHRPDGDQPQPTDYSSPHNHSASPSMSHIPNLDGLPPINSCGYVVRESPSDTPPGQFPPQDPLDSSPKARVEPESELNTRAQQPSVVEVESMNQFPSCNNQNHNNLYALGNMLFPHSSHDEMNFPPPEFWQIPLTADWEIGGQFLGGTTGHPDNSGGQGENYFFQGNNAQMIPPAAAAVVMPSPSIGGPLGAYQYGPQGNFAQGPDSGHPGSAFMDADFANNRY